MSYKKYIEFLNRYSYDRYNNFDNLDNDKNVYPIMKPIDCYEAWKLETDKLREVKLGATFPLIQNTLTFKNMKECISILSYYSVSILRCEAQNPYFYHTAVPSAKGIHPCECYFITKVKGAARLLRFNSASSTLEYISKKDDAATEKLINKEFEEDELIIIITSDMFRLSKYYGSFAYILSAIDAGHISSQIGMLAARGAAELETYVDIDIKSIADYLKVDFNEIHPELMMKVKLSKDIESVNIDFNNIKDGVRNSFYSEDMKEFNQITNFNNLLIEDFRKKADFKEFKTSKYKILENKDILSCKDTNLNTAIYNRTSAQNVLGTFSLSIYIKNEDFKKASKELYNYLSHTNLEENIRVYCFINKVEGYEKGWYLLEKEGFSFIKPDKQDNMINFLHDSHEFFSITTMPVVFFFEGNIKKYYDLYELNGVKALYINTGEACQGASIAFSEIGYFARPLKNLNERYVEKVLNLDECERVTYMLAIGKNNISSLDLEVI